MVSYTKLKKMLKKHYCMDHSNRMAYKLDTLLYELHYPEGSGTRGYADYFSHKMYNLEKIMGRSQVGVTKVEQSKNVFSEKL